MSLQYRVFQYIDYERQMDNDALLQREWLQKILRFDRMDRLLMTLGFTESKVDSNLCFKFEGGRPVMLLLCVNALFSRHGGVAEYSSYKGSMQ